MLDHSHVKTCYIYRKSHRKDEVVGMRTVSHVFELLILWMTLVGEVIESLGCGTSLEEVYWVGGRGLQGFTAGPHFLFSVSLSLRFLCVDGNVIIQTPAPATSISQPFVML